MEIYDKGLFTQQEFDKALLVFELEKIKKWFDTDYTRLEQKYRRLHTLQLLCDNGETPYNALIWLYQVAENKRKRIQELEGLINE